MTEGLVLGFLSWLSLIMSWYHLPAFLKRFTMRHLVLSDFIATVLSFIFISGISHSIVAVFGAMFSGLLVNFTLIAAEFWNKHYDKKS